MKLAERRRLRSLPAGAARVKLAGIGNKTSENKP
jgi:hypothetical protein